MTTSANLRAAIARTGYYPELVTAAVMEAVAQEPVEAFVLSHEATFDHEQLHRHMTVVVLTPHRLIVSHTDEHPPNEVQLRGGATTSTESVKLAAVASVVVQRTVSNPVEFGSSESILEEIVITIGWGAVSRIEMGVARCDDPSCEAEHGYSGTTTNDDLQIRVSRAADGADRVLQAAEFAQALARVTTRPASL